MGKTPVIDISECNSCDGCLDISPNTFVYNDDLDFIEVVARDQYDTAEVDEAIKNCPKNAISWE